MTVDHLSVLCIGEKSDDPLSPSCLRSKPIYFHSLSKEGKISSKSRKA